MFGSVRVRWVAGGEKGDRMTRQFVFFLGRKESQKHKHVVHIFIVF